MSSTFTNITASGTITADTVVCDTLVTNTALSSTTYGGSTVQTNTIIPYTGNTITINGPTAGLDTLDINSRSVLFDGNVDILGTTTTKNINAGTSNIIGGNLIISNTITGSFLTLSNLNAGNVISNYANISNIFIGKSASYTQSSGTALVMSQNTTFDNTVNGAISGNVYPQFSFGSGREHLFATDVGNANISYYGISDLTAPDSDFMITYKNKVGMKISPTPTNTDFTEALRVVGTANISGNIALGGNISTVGNVYQTYTLNSPINATIHTAYIEPCLNDTSKNVIIKGESATTGATVLYGGGVFSYADTYIDKGLSIGTGSGLGVNGSKLISNKGSVLYGNTSVVGNLNINGAITGTTTFNDDITGTNATLSGNVNSGNINVSGNLYMSAMGQSARIREIWYSIPFADGNRSVYAFAGLTGTTIGSGSYLPYLVPSYNSISTSGGSWFIFFTNPATKILKAHIQIRFGANQTFTSALIQARTGTTGALTTGTNKTSYSFPGTYNLGSNISFVLPFVVDNTEPYFNFAFTGSLALSISGGASPVFASHILIEEVLCR